MAAWYVPLLEFTNSQSEMRATLLAFAAVLVLFAFTALHDSHSRIAATSRGGRASFQLVPDRYRRE